MQNLVFRTLKGLLDTVLISGIRGIRSTVRLQRLLSKLGRVRPPALHTGSSNARFLGREEQDSFFARPIPSIADTLIVVMQRQLDFSKAWDSVSVTRDVARRALADPEIFDERSDPSKIDADKCYDGLVASVEEWEAEHGRGAPIPWRSYGRMMGRRIRTVVEIVQRQPNGEIELGIASPWHYFRRFRRRCGVPLSVRELDDAIEHFEGTL